MQYQSVRKSIPFQRAVEFVRLPANAMYEIEIPKGEGAKFVHRMRVELSKMRNIVKNAGHTLNKFKMLHVKTENVDEKTERVTLQKVVGSKNPMSVEIEKILSDMEVANG